MSMSEAQKKAKEKYIKENYKNVQIKIRLPEYQMIDEYCKHFNISKSRFIIWACNYFASQGILPPESEVLQEYTSADDLNDNNGGNG